MWRLAGLQLRRVACLRTEKTGVASLVSPPTNRTSPLLIASMLFMDHDLHRRKGRKHQAWMDICLHYQKHCLQKPHKNAENTYGGLSSWSSVISGWDDPRSSSSIVPGGRMNMRCLRSIAETTLMRLKGC